MLTQDKYTGCFLGLALGDAYGAPYEGGPIERLLWQAIGRTRDGRRRYTDDTQMSIDLAISLLQQQGVDQNHLAHTFAESYRWSRGYGPSAGKLLKEIRRGVSWQTANRAKYPEGSMGNGAAMRAPIVALCFPNNDALLTDNITRTAEITHAHPLAIEGAQLIAFTVCSVLNNIPPQEIVESLINRCNLDLYKEKLAQCATLLGRDASSKDIVNALGNGMLATESCVTAIYFSLHYLNEPFDTLLKKIIKLGGDVDTIAAMAGAIWGAANGSSSLQTMKSTLENSEHIVDLAQRLHSTFS